MPEFAGNMEKDPGTKRSMAVQQSFAASLVKISAMYAAFQLRYDLNVLAHNNPSWTTKELFAAARDSWQKTQIGTGSSLPIHPKPKIESDGRLIKLSGNRVPLTFKNKNFLNDAPTTEICTLSLHNALPICPMR